MKIVRIVIAIPALLVFAACANMQLGTGGSMVAGSAGAEGSASGAARELQRCNRPIGTIALIESQIPALAQIGLASPVPLIRLMVAQSGCFNVVERGQALTRMTEERALAAGSMLQQGANIGRGQVVAADYMITPNIAFSEYNAGGLGAAAGTVLSAFVPGGYVLGQVAGSLSFKEAQAMLMVTDTRTGVQVGIAEGSAKATDLGGGMGLGRLRGFGSLGGYSNTNEGKVVAGAFLDAFNKLVDQLRKR